MKNEYNIIYEDVNSSRIDKWLTDNTEYSRSVIQNIIKEGNLFVNGKVVKSSYKLQSGDEINFTYEEKVMDLIPQEVDFDIVYEDDDIIIVNKPLGLVVHPGVGNKDMTLVNGLLHHFDTLSDMDTVRPGIVHRIDKDTTGLLIVAKNNAIHQVLQDMIKSREISREYIALVHGNINHKSGTIDAPIGRDKNNRQVMCICDENSKHAITHFEVIKESMDFTLLKCKLDTGRTHQIRVHMKYIKHPIVGDPIYGYRKTIGNVQLLHAFKLSFVHPVTNEEMEFYADIPQHFLDVIDQVGITKENDDEYFMG